MAAETTAKTADRAKLEELRDFLTYERDVTPAMVEEGEGNEYAQALAKQIGEAWKLADDYLRGAG
jgi:hypothetical protein